MKPIQHSLPFLFCLVLAILGFTATMIAPGWGGLGLVWFLPMCFLLSSSVTLHLQREIVKLRSEIEELKRRTAE